jgi:uncharacterized protein YlzI (FlbEa/FlbD family)
MINTNKYIETLSKAKTDLKNGKQWGEVWNNVKKEFKDLPSEQIDNDLGLEWRQAGAYDLYLKGKLTPIRPTEKYDYFSDLRLAKQKIIDGASIDKVKNELKAKYKSVDDVKVLADLNQTPGHLPVAGPMTPAIKKEQTVSPAEKLKIEAYQKTLDPAYLTGAKDPIKDSKKIELEAIEKAKSIKPIESTNPKPIVEPVTIVEPEKTKKVEIIESQKISAKPKLELPKIPYDIPVQPYTEPVQKVEEGMSKQFISPSINILDSAFNPEDPDIISLNRKYGDNASKLTDPENKDIFNEVITITKPKIDEIIAPILAGTTPGYNYITEKLDEFYNESKNSNALLYETNKAINNASIDNSTVPNPFFAETIIPKYKAVINDLNLNIDNFTSISTPSFIEPKKIEEDKTIILMSPISDSTPALVIPDQDVKDIIAKRIDKETKLEKWQIDLAKARKDKELLLTSELPAAIAEFNKLGLGDFGDRIPTAEEINKALVERQLKISNIPEDSLIGQVRVAQKDMIVQEAGILGSISGKLSKVFSGTGSESAKDLREKFGEGSEELIKALSSIDKLDASGTIRNELNDIYTESTQTEAGLMQKYKDVNIELEKLLSTPGMEDYISSAQKDLSAISQQEYVGLLNFQSQNKAAIDRLNTLGKRIEDIKAELSRNSITGNNAVARYKDINNQIKNSFNGLITVITSSNFRKMVTSGNIMSASEADQLIKTVKQYEKNRVFAEQNNDKFLNELNKYDEKTQVALLEEGVLQDKVQNIFDNISKISNKLVDADKREKYYSGFDEIYELQRQSKVAQAAAESWDVLHPWKFKTLKQSTKDVFGENAASYDYKDVQLEMGKQVVPAVFGTVFNAAGEVITFIPDKVLSSIDGLVKLITKVGNYELTGLEKLGVRGSMIDTLKEYNNQIINSKPLSETVGKELAETAAYMYKNLYTESFPQMVNMARNTATLLDIVGDFGSKKDIKMREWFLGGLENMGLPSEAKYFLESYSDMLDPFVQGTRFIHAIRVGMNNPDLPENADLLWTEYDKKVLVTPMQGKLENFLDPWDYERIDEIKSLNKNISDFDDIPEGTELIIYPGNPRASNFAKTMDKRNKFIAGKISEDRFITNEVMSLYDIVKPGPDREKIISSILDLNDFNALGLHSGNTKDWTEIPKGITIRVPKAYDEPILSNMLFSTENRLKWAKEHPVRYTLFEEAIVKNVVDPINFLWVPGLNAIKLGSKTIFKSGYSGLANSAERSAYAASAKKMADFTWSLSRVLFEKKAPLPGFYSNPEKLGLFQLIGKGMKFNSLDLTTLSTFRTKLAAMSVVNALPEMFRPIVKMTDNDINNLREMNTIKYIESINKLVDENGLTKDQIETFLVNYIKAGARTTKEERNIFRVFSENMGLSLQELEDIIDTSHPEFYYDKVYTTKETNLKDIVKPEIYNDPIKLKEVIRINDFEKRKIDPEKIPAGLKIKVSEDNFVNKVKDSIHYSRYVTKPEAEYMMLRMDKLDDVGMEAFFNFFRRVPDDKAKPFRLIMNQKELDQAISRMHTKYPTEKKSINQAVDLAKEFRRRTNFFADAVENDILVPVKVTDNIKLFILDNNKQLKNFKLKDKSAFITIKDADTGEIRLIYNQQYTGKFGLGMDLIGYNTKLYGKKIKNLDKPVGTMTTEMKYMEVSGGKKSNTWFRENPDGSTELMIQEGSGQKPVVGYTWKNGGKGKEITLRSLLVTAAIRKEIGWLRTFFTTPEYAKIFGSRIIKDGKEEFTQGLLDKIISVSGKKIKVKESYKRDFFDVINDIKSNKKFFTSKQEIDVFNGDTQAEFLLSLSASIQELYFSNRKLFNVTYGSLKKTYDILQNDIQNKLRSVHQMSPVEELTMLIMEKIDKNPNLFGNKSKIIGRLLNDVNITSSEMKSITNELESLADSRRQQLKKAIVLNKLRQDGLSESTIKDINSGIRTYFKFNTSKGETSIDSIKRLLRTIPGFISPEDANRLKIGKLSDEQIKQLGIINKAEYLYATNKINRRFTYLTRKNISADMMPEVVDKFTRPMVDAAVDLMAKLDLDNSAPKTRIAAIIKDAIIHSQEKKIALILPEGIVSHKVIDVLDKMEVEAANTKLLLIQAKKKYKDIVYAGKKVKSDKYKYFEQSASKKVEGLTSRYNELRTKGEGYAKKHGEEFKDRLSDELQIIPSSRLKKELVITPEIEKAIYSVKSGENSGATLVISDRTPEGKAVIDFIRSRPDEFVEGSDFIVEKFDKLKDQMTSKEVTQLMLDKGMNPLLYWMLDKSNGLSMYNDNLVNLLSLSTDPTISLELKKVYFDKLYKALITSDVLSFDIFKKEFPDISEQRLMLMDKNEIIKEITTSKLSSSRKKELLNLAKRKGASIMQEKLKPSEIELRTITGKTEQGLESLASDINISKRQTPVGESTTAKDIPDGIDPDKLNELSLSESENKESKINLLFNEKVMDEMEDLNSALFAIKKALGISSIERIDKNNWKIDKSFEGNQTTSDQLALLGITGGKYIGVGDLTDEVKRRITKTENIVSDFDKEKFIDKVGVAFDVPNKMGHEELEDSIVKIADLKEARNNKIDIENKLNSIDSNIAEIKYRISENEKNKVKGKVPDKQIEKYNDLNKKFNESIIKLERSKNDLSVELDNINRKIDSTSDATDFLINGNKFDSESYKYIEERISSLKNSIFNVNKKIADSPNTYIKNNLLLSKSIIEKELARYNSILDIIVPWNLGKVNGITFTAKEIYQAVKGYISPDMEDKLNRLSEINKAFMLESNKSSLTEIGLDDVNLPTVTMEKIDSKLMQTNFWDSLSKIKSPKEIRVPKVDVININSINDTKEIIEAITDLVEKTGGEKRYPLVIDLTGKLKQKLSRSDNALAGKIHIVSNDKITSDALKNINISAGTSLTSAEVEAYNTIIKNINEHGPVWIFGEKAEKVSPASLKDSFYNKALDKKEIELLTQARKDFDKINSKFRESISGDTMFFPEDPDSLLSKIVGTETGDISKETIAQSDAILASRVNKYMNRQDVSKYMIENNVGESKVLAFQDSVKNKKLLIIADDKHSTLYKDQKNTLDEARKNGMTFVFPKDMTRGEMLIYEYLNQFPNVKFSTIKNSDISTLRRMIRTNDPDILFTISKNFDDKGRASLLKAWSEENNGIIRIYESSEKMLNSIQSELASLITKYQNTKENFLPEFTKQKAIYGERPQDILVDLASVKKTNDIKKKMDIEITQASKDYREALIKMIPENADSLTRRAMMKQIENDVASTNFLMDQIKTEVFSFGKGTRLFEELRRKVSSRLAFYGMYDQPQVGLNPGYPDVIPEYVLALRSAEWMLNKATWLSDNFSSAGRVLMSSWIRAVLLYRPRWQIWNALGDGARAIGASKNVFIMAKYLESLSRGMAMFYWKTFKETVKLPLELLPKNARNKLGKFMDYSLIDIDFTKPIARTKYFELKGSLTNAHKLLNDGGVTAIGETITTADMERLVSSGIDRIIADPRYAQVKIDLIKDSGLASRLGRRLKVIDSDLQIVSSALETSRRAVLAWDLLYKKSMNIAAAEMKVKKWMFDYRELTLAGRLLRNFFPFYTFTSKSIQLYLSVCLKYGPGTWRAAVAVLDAFEEKQKDLPDQYKNRIEVGNNIWWLTSFGIKEYFEMIFNPTKMVQEFIKNPSRMLFGLSFGPIGSSAMTVITGQGYYDTTASTQEFYDRGWTTEDIQNFRNKEDSKFSDSITFDKTNESLYTFLASVLPFGQLTKDLASIDISTILRGNTTFNSKKVRLLMNYFFGANYKKMEDIEMVFDTIMKLPPGEQYILQESLKKENPDLYGYLQEYSVLSKVTKVLNAKGKDWNEKSQDLVKSIITYNYYNLEAKEHGSGDEWLNENPQYAKIMQEVWSNGSQTSSKIYGKEKFDVSQIRSIANKILSNVKDADDKKISKMKLAGIDVPFGNAISKEELRNAMYDQNGNFRLNSLDQLATIVDAYGLEGELFDINKVKTEAEKGYQDFKNLSLKAREEKRLDDQKYYDSMSVVFKVLPNNLDELSQEESAKVWDEYNRLLETLILSNPEYKKKYYDDMPEWQRKYNEFKIAYSETWTKLRNKFNDPDQNFFKQFNKQPTWFRNWYFYDNPEKKITFPKFSIIFNELEKNPSANYYDLFYQKPGDKGWDDFRSQYFKDNPGKKIYYPVAAIYNKTINRIVELKGEDATKEWGSLYDWLWSKQDALKAWDKDKPGQYIYIEKLRELNKSGDGTDYYTRFYTNKDKSWDEFRKVYFERNPLRKEYYPLALKLEGKTWEERESILKDPANKAAIIAWDKDKPGRLEKSQAYLKYEKMWGAFDAIDNMTWEGKRERATYLNEHPDLVKMWDNNDTPEQLAVKHKQKEYFNILYQIPADGTGRDYLIKYYTLKSKADKYLEDNPDIQKYWDSLKKTYTGKEKVIRDLLSEYNKIELQVDKTSFILKHPELSEYFLNQAPPGIRKLMILEKLYFQIDGSEKRTAFVKARPELAEYWELKKMPASFLSDPKVMKEYQAKLDSFLQFTNAIQAKDDVQVELFRKSVSEKPDTSTAEGKWLADKMYQASMKAWASTFGSILSTYFFRTLPAWIRNEYFKSHPKSKVLSYMSLGRALEEGLRIYSKQNKEETWADSLMFKYGKDMPFQLKEKVSREMIRLGKWTDRSTWSKERWAEYQLDKLARTGRIRRQELSNNKLLNLEAQRVARTFTSSMFNKPLKEFGTLNVFKGSVEAEKNPSNIFLGAEELVLRTIPSNKRVMKLFDYEV